MKRSLTLTFEGYEYRATLVHSEDWCQRGCADGRCKCGLNAIELTNMDEPKFDSATLPYHGPLTVKGVREAILTGT